jgi:hypothetical protein
MTKSANKTRAGGNRYYVYELIDPRSSLPFYVGKGTGKRAWAHAGNERAGREPNPHKAEILGQLRRAGLAVEVRIVQDGLSETEAFSAERRRIYALRGTLTNASKGQQSPTDRSRLWATNMLADIKPFDVWRRAARPTEHDIEMYWAVKRGFEEIAANGWTGGIFIPLSRAA